MLSIYLRSKGPGKRLKAWGAHMKGPGFDVKTFDREGKRWQRPSVWCFNRITLQDLLASRGRESKKTYAWEWGQRASAAEGQSWEWKIDLGKKKRLRVLVNSLLRNLSFPRD